MIRCNECNSKSISEQVWVESNSEMTNRKKLYFAFDFNIDSSTESLFYCHNCRDITSVIDTGE